MLSRKPPSKRNVFYETIDAAIADITQHGFDSIERIADWMTKIRTAAAQTLTPPAVLQNMLAETLRTIYQKLIDRRGIAKYHPGVGRFTIERLRPQLRAELERRIMASANLIRLNRDAAIEKTLQRFSGWATSVPAGGSKIVERGPVKENIRKALASLPFEERRVLIDQGHKFTADLSNVIAMSEGAIAAVWHHHHVTYPRPEHLDRDGQVFLIRDSWAHQKGLVKAVSGRYVDTIERPGELPLCRCDYEYRYDLRDLPAEMLTAKGRAELMGVHIA